MTEHNGQLKALVERIETVEQAVTELNEDKKEIYIEAKSSGYDCKALRTIIRMRKESAEDRAEREAILETYMHALGMTV